MKTLTLVKHEWHQVDAQFAYELTEDTLAEIYPDYDGDEISALMDRIESGEEDLETILQDAYNEDVDIEWERQYDDWWTDRKGGYEVTFELGDETSWYDDPAKAPVIPTHACTKCRWQGESWDTTTIHLREDGSIIEDYYNTEEESHHTKDICPMCDGDTILTEHGQTKKAEREQLLKDLEELNEEE